MDFPKFIVSNQKDDSISVLRVNFLFWLILREKKQEKSWTP